MLPYRTPLIEEDSQEDSALRDHQLVHVLEEERRLVATLICALVLQAGSPAPVRS